MHTVEKTEYGYRITFVEAPGRDDMGTLLELLKRTIHPRDRGFGLLADLRIARAFGAEVQEVLKQTILSLKEAGMQRHIVVLDSAITKLQARRLGKETGIDPLSRCLDASSRPDWERAADDWLRRGIDPDGAG
ncbi:MAG: hypothetical protein M3O15_04465 [Acidobacteriota bacterium]|nr:hypothetical protein [Acidobacteriota bacterium]